MSRENCGHRSTRHGLLVWRFHCLSLYWHWGDAQFRAPELSYVGNLETGQLRRNVGVAGAYFRPASKLSLSTDFEAASGDRTYFRTSLQDYTKVKARARYQVHTALQVSASFSLLDNQNPAPTVNCDFRSRTNSLSLYWTPAGGKWISVLGEYTRSTLRSDITYLVPQTLTRARSFYRDNAHSTLSMVDFNLPKMNGGKPKISLGGSLYLSSGTRPRVHHRSENCEVTPPRRLPRKALLLPERDFPDSGRLISHRPLIVKRHEVWAPPPGPPCDSSNSEICNRYVQ